MKKKQLKKNYRKESPFVTAVKSRKALLLWC